MNSLLYLLPRGPASDVPILDDATRRMTAAFRRARDTGVWFAGVHTCVCGAVSTCHDYILSSGERTNSLCIHYLAHHRAEVPADSLEAVLRLNDGEEEPSHAELEGPAQTRPRVIAQVSSRLSKVLPLLHRQRFDVDGFIEWFMARTPERGRAETILDMLGIVRGIVPQGGLDLLDKTLKTQPRSTGGVPEALDVALLPQVTWLPIWEKFSAAGSAGVRSAAVEGLVTCGKEKSDEGDVPGPPLPHEVHVRVRARLAALVWDSELDVRREALNAWIRIVSRSESSPDAPPAADGVCQFLVEIAERSDDPGLRATAITNLRIGLTRSEVPPVATMLQIAVCDDSLVCRALAFQALSQMHDAVAHVHGAGSQCLSSLVECVLHGSDRAVYDVISELLRKVPCEPSRLAEPFARALAHEEPAVRLHSARFLARNPAVANLVVDALQGARGDANPNVAHAAASALQRMGLDGGDMPVKRGRRAVKERSQVARRSRWYEPLLRVLGFRRK